MSRDRNSMDIMLTLVGRDRSRRRFTKLPTW